jgi:amidase
LKILLSPIIFNSETTFIGGTIVTLSQLTANELRKAFQDKTLSPVEVVDELFKTIAKENPTLNAFVTLNEEAARENAKEAESAYINKTAKPLEGIPIAIKDLTNTKGLRTTFGTPLYKDHVPDRDATIVERLKAAGTIIMGKTNTPEYGYKATTDNPLFGATRNPWDTETNSGGSSGGSASAVSAGLVPLAEGSDGGGSIRIPAALCGIFGFKPSFGRIPYDNHLDGVYGNHEPFVHFGTLTRSVADAALMYDVIKGYSDKDPFSLPDDPTSAFDGLQKERTHELRIGWTLDFGMYDVDAEVAQTFCQTIDHLSAEGFNVRAVKIDTQKTLREYIEYFEKLWTVGLAAGLQDTMVRHPDVFSLGLQDSIKRGSILTAVEFKALEGYRAYLWHKMQNLFHDIDILLSPTLAVPAFHYDLEGPSSINGKPIKADSDWVMTQIYNLTGQPAISIPIGLTKDGLPVGMQAASARLNDNLLLSFANAFEQHFPTLSGAVMNPQKTTTR